MRLLALMLSLVALSAAAASAPAAPKPKRETITVTTSIGPLDEETDTRELRARGTAPRGSRLEVRYYRRSKRLGTERPKLKGRRYASALAIDRTGVYKVKVIALTPRRQRLVVSATLRYTPDANAPSAPEDTQG